MENTFKEGRWGNIPRDSSGVRVKKKKGKDVERSTSDQREYRTGFEYPTGVKK